MSDRLEADYLIETAMDPSRAAEIMAGEQSSGTFVAVPGETQELKALAAAHVEAVEVYESADAPSLSGAANGDTYSRARVTLSWPIGNMGVSLPNAMTTVSGNLYELKPFSGLRLAAVRLPAAYSDAYPGPRFGIEGTRRLTGVSSGPLIGTIIKPSVGFSPEQTAERVRDLVEAGVDFIKDDELQADGPHCPFRERVVAVMAVINAHADRTCKKVMYAFNLTGEVDEMRTRHDWVLRHGGTCVMASVNSVGLGGMLALGRHSQVPVHAHRNGWGYLSRHPMLGWSFPAWSTFWRLAGADHLHVNGLQNKFCESDDSVIEAAQSLLTPMFANKPCITMPVFSSGQSAIQPAETFHRMQTTDLIYAAGGGLVGHPDGIAAGVDSLREAWMAAEAGIPAEVYAKDHPALARALDAYAQ